jgi:hypothetical protein
MSSFLSVLLAFSGAIYIDGYGWAPGEAVNHCLIAVGAPHVDTLHDAQWEEFVSCLASNT